MLWARLLPDVMGCSSPAISNSGQLVVGGGSSHDWGSGTHPLCAFGLDGSQRWCTPLSEPLYTPVTAFVDALCDKKAYFECEQAYHCVGTILEIDGGCIDPC